MKTAIITVVTAIMLLGASSLAEATIEPNLSIGVATDKLTYELGEYVTIYITGYNVGSETITLGFGTLSQASYLMDDVYDWYAHHYHYGGISYRVIEPGEDYTWTLVHSSVDMGYYPLTVGTHSVKGEIVGYGYSAPVEFEVVPEPVVIEAAVDIEPDVLNPKSKGKYITCYIWLPEDCNVADVNSASVFLEDELAPDWIWFNENQNVVMAKFPRSEVQAIIEPGEVELTVSGELIDGTRFEGSDTIRVIDKGRLRGRRINSNSKVVDGIEYYIQTDKAVYNLGEDVDFLYRVTNLRDEEWRIEWGFPIFDVIAEEKDGENFNEIWHWSWDKIHHFGGIVVILGPQESTELNEIWPQIDLNGSVEPEDHTHVPPGRYRISGVFYPTDSNIAVDITIIRREGRGRPTRVNSNSIVKDYIEYYIQTDKSVYDLGENVEILYRITNLTDEELTIPCSRSPEFNLWVQKEGGAIWMKVQGWYWFSPGITLSAGESEEIRCNWDMKDNDGNLLEPGVYNVVGVMYNEPWNDYNHGIPYATEVAVPIKIIPEPKGRVKHN